MNLQLASSFTLPLEAATRRMAILAMSGAGKSNTAVVLAEEFYKAGIPWVAIDGKGDWFGIRSNAAGDGPGLPIPVFGGLHGDIPLEATAGKLIADLIVETRLTCVLDVSEFNSRADMFRFLTDLGEELLRRNREPLHLFLEEADDYLPQSAKEGQVLSRCLGVWQRVVKRGRFRGIGSTQITQRSSALNKDTLNMAECLIAMRNVAPHDKKAIQGWVEYHGLGKEVVNTIPELEDGEAWVFSPVWLKTLERVKFRKRSTFDSGATPEFQKGKATRAPATLADIDLGKLKERMSATLEKAKADDPAELRKQILTLRKELSDAQKEKPAQVVRDESAIAAAVQEATTPLVRRIDQYETAFQEIGEIAQRLADLCKDRVEINALVRKVEAQRPAPVEPVAKPAPPTRAPKPIANIAPGEVPQGCAKPLAALAAVYPSGLTEPQWATSAGYKRTGGTWGAYKSRLRSAGLIETRKGRWFATEAGASAAGNVELPPPPGPDLVRWWAAKLPGTGKIAEALIEAWPNGLSKDELADRVGMTASGGSFGAYLSRLSGPGLISRDGSMVRLTAEGMGA